MLSTTAVGFGGVKVSQPIHARFMCTPLVRDTAIRSLCYICPNKAQQVTSIDIESGLSSINHSIIIAPSALVRIAVSFPFFRILFDDNSPTLAFFPTFLLCCSSRPPFAFLNFDRLDSVFNRLSAPPLLRTDPRRTNPLDAGLCNTRDRHASTIGCKQSAQHHLGTQSLQTLIGATTCPVCSFFAALLFSHVMTREEGKSA